MGVDLFAHDLFENQFHFSASCFRADRHGSRRFREQPEQPAGPRLALNRAYWGGRHVVSGRLSSLGPGFAALYYDHDVKSFTDQDVCERTLPELEQRAKEAKDFMNAVTDAAGDKNSEVVFQLACIDKTPQEFQRELHSLQDQVDDGSNI
jgi:hypothetical protein